MALLKENGKVIVASENGVAVEEKDNTVHPDPQAPKTPEQIAADIMKAATEDVLITIGGTFAQKLEAIASYNARDTSALRGERWFEKNKSRLMDEAVEKLIADRHKALNAYQTKKEQDNKMQYFLLLRSKGMDAEQAYKESGCDQISVEAKQ